MRYPFYLMENLTTVAVSRDLTSFTNLVERNFTVIMNTHSQSKTLRWLRVAQLESQVTRALLRAGADADKLYRVSQDYLEKIALCRVNAVKEMRQVLIDFCAEGFGLLPQTARNYSSLLQRFLSALERAELAQMTVGSIAGEFDIDPSHLCRAIKSATGRTPIDHIRLAKLARARERLLTCSVTKAAMDSGFGKASTFIASFRKEFGETPGMYRRRLMLGETAADSPSPRVH